MLQHGLAYKCDILRLCKGLYTQDGACSCFPVSRYYKSTWGSDASSQNSQSAPTFEPAIEFLWANLSLAQSTASRFIAVR